MKLRFIQGESQKLILISILVMKFFHPQLSYRILQEAFNFIIVIYFILVFLLILKIISSTLF